MRKTAEELAREMLARMGFTEYRTNGDLIELANLISYARALYERRYRPVYQFTEADHELIRRLGTLIEGLERREG